MGDSALIYKEKFQAHLSESFIHLKQLNTSLEELEQKNKFPLELLAFYKKINNNQ